MDFCTMGMFIIDDIYPAPSDPDQTPRLSIPGGAGTYCALGARILSPPPDAAKVGWIIDTGTDFPKELLQIIESWQTGVLLRQRDGLTTKGWNGYSANEHRAFKYLTPKVRIAENDLTPALLSSRTFHMVCSQERCMDLVQGITAQRNQAHPDLGMPIFIYEPVPDLAIPAALDTTFEACKHVQVISPNHSELANIFGRLEELGQGGMNARLVEDCSRQLLDHASSASHDLVVAVRAGAYGCYIATNGKSKISKWLPAYHNSSHQRVIDPTGGGNGFLGGYAIGLVRTGDAIKAAMWGSISASFCIEQVGIPVLGCDTTGREIWNGSNAFQRLSDFENRCAEQSDYRP